MFDILIKNGAVVDGTGSEPRTADIAIQGDRIVAVGKISEPALRVIDAEGLLVTPGFVDIHTHYDAQATWSTHMTPSSAHGVTTAVMGNCGVGFAPCRPENRDGLIELMEGVEDIPGVVMAEGLPWDWESFPEFMDSVDKRPRDIDLAVFLPHSPLRVHVMGERGLRREDATDEDLKAMADLAREAAEAGAIGFATSRLSVHKSSAGDLIPSYKAAARELIAISRGVAEGGAAILQSSFEPSSPGTTTADLQLFSELSKATGLPLTFSMAQADVAPDLWKSILTQLTEINANGAKLSGQVLPRPIGLLVGLDATAHPFSLCPSYAELAHLPLAEKVARMRDPELRAKLLAEEPMDHSQAIVKMARKLDSIYELGNPPNYEPKPEDSIANRAARAGSDALPYVYDLLVANNGENLLYIPLANFSDKSLDAVNAMLDHPDITLGLGDGGAHYGLICDSSFTTFVITHWCRDRQGPQRELGEMIRRLTWEPAQLVGLKDRGLIKPGYKADINLIDFDKLELHHPEMVRDLPGGGKRLYQSADGYVETILSGVTTYKHGQPTEQLPGKLIRGPRQAPAAA